MSDNKEIYKKISQEESQNRIMRPLSQKHSEQARSIIKKFIKYLIIKHT